MPTAKQKAMLKAQELGVTVIEGRGFDPCPWEVELQAPTGKTFASTGTHDIITSQYPGDSRSETWERVWEEMEEGLEDCEAGVNCESCYSPEE